MSNVSAYAGALLLNFLLNAQTATRPTAWGVGLSLGSPTSVSGSEITTGSGYARASATFPAASTPGSATNGTAMTYGPFSGAASISGANLWDTVLSLNSGNLLMEGLLATARTVGIGDSLVIGSAAMTITMS